MAKTLLNAVNEVLKKVQSISTDLTLLTDSAKQRDINLAVQTWNEATDLLFTSAEIPIPQEQAESTITLVASQRDYALASDLVQMRWPLIDKTNSQFIYEHPGGYNEILLEDPEQDDDGLAITAAIRATDGKLYLSRSPTSDDAGKVYTYQYDKDIGVSSASDTVPFGDMTFRAMVVAAAQLWNAQRNNIFNKVLFDSAMAQAARTAKMDHARTSWSPR